MFRSRACGNLSALLRSRSLARSLPRSRGLSCPACFLSCFKCCPLPTSPLLETRSSYRLPNTRSPRLFCARSSRVPLVCPPEQDTASRRVHQHEATLSTQLSGFDHPTSIVSPHFQKFGPARKMLQRLLVKDARLSRLPALPESPSKHHERSYRPPKRRLYLSLCARGLPHRRFDAPDEGRDEYVVVPPTGLHAQLTLLT